MAKKVMGIFENYCTQACGCFREIIPGSLTFLWQCIVSGVMSAFAPGGGL